MLPNFFLPANLSRSPDEIYQRLLQKSLRVTATARRRVRGVRVFRRLSGILIGRGCRNRFPKTRSPCDLRVRGLRAPRNVEKISARFVPPRWYPEVGIGLLNGGLKGFLNRVRRYERVGIALTAR